MMILNSFNGGYTKALLDIQKFFELNGYSWSKKSLKTFIEVCIDRREELRETGEIKGLIWNKKDGFSVKK